MHAHILSFLDEIARQGSIRKAAKVLHISSTSINRQLLNLEDHLGVKLFDRTPQGVIPTTAGNILLEHCRKTLLDFAQVKILIDDLRDLHSGHLRIQTIDSMVFGFLPAILRLFTGACPGISLSVITSDPHDITEALVCDDCDIGINFVHDVHPDLRVFLQKSTPLGAVMRPDHPLATRNQIDLADLEDYSLVRTIDARRHQSIVDQAVPTQATQSNIYLYTNEHAIAKQAILDNQAIGIYTKIGFMEDIAEGWLKFVPLAHPELETHKIGLVVSATQSIDPIKRHFFTAAERILAQVSFDR